MPTTSMVPTLAAFLRDDNYTGPSVCGDLWDGVIVVAGQGLSTGSLTVLALHVGSDPQP